MSNEIVISSSVIISAIIGDERQYYAIDSHSGGYPYWSDYVRSAHRFDNMNKIPTDFNGYMGDKVSRIEILGDKVSRIEILQVKEVATVISTEDIVSAAKQKALAEIAVIEKQLQEKTEQLRRMQ